MFEVIENSKQQISWRVSNSKKMTMYLLDLNGITVQDKKYMWKNVDSYKLHVYRGDRYGTDSKNYKYVVLFFLKKIGVYTPDTVEIPIPKSIANDIDLFCSQISIKQKSLPLSKFSVAVFVVLFILVLILFSQYLI